MKNTKKRIINNFSYFTNCSISGNFPRKDGTDKNSKSFLSLESKWHRHFDSTKHLMETTIKIIKEKYKNIKVIKLTDNSTINCSINKFPLYIYMILYYGETYYMKYGFLPENKSRNLEIINIRINEKTIKLENIIEFTKNNLFPEETNKDFIKLCKKIVKKNNKLKYFLEEIKFIKDKGKKNCNYFFSFLEYIYTIFFPGFNFFQESYSISL